MIVTGREKALVGGLGAGITSLAGQVAINQQLTLKEVLYSVATWVFTHVFVYYTTNTPVVQNAVKPAEVVTPTEPTP